MFKKAYSAAIPNQSSAVLHCLRVMKLVTLANQQGIYAKGFQVIKGIENRSRQVLLCRILLLLILFLLLLGTQFDRQLCMW